MLLEGFEQERCQWCGPNNGGGLRGKSGSQHRGTGKATEAEAIPRQTGAAVLHSKGKWERKAAGNTHGKLILHLLLYRFGILIGLVLDFS